MTPMGPRPGYRAITVVLNRDGTAETIAATLKEEHGILTGNIQNARGTGDPSRKSSFMNQVEKDLFTVTIPADRAEEIFNLIFFECQIGKRFGGFMYQSHLSQLSEFALPDHEEE